MRQKTMKPASAFGLNESRSSRRRALLVVVVAPADSELPLGLDLAFNHWSKRKVLTLFASS